MGTTCLVFSYWIGHHNKLNQLSNTVQFRGGILIKGFTPIKAAPFTTQYILISDIKYTYLNSMSYVRRGIILLVLFIKHKSVT
jgi:hypothetical protein